MSYELENVLNSMNLGVLPEYWKKHSYPSLKPLNSYIADLVKRLKYFKQWIAKKPPKIHWISGFYFTHSFLTGIK